jgi:2',3'-cyclic-nucleotide 2'-phosphodiesterase (5'-nucleotidase family)
MKKNTKLLYLILPICLFLACSPKHYAVKSIESTHVEIDNRYDAQANPQLAAMIATYKTQMEAEMNQPVGEAAQTLVKGFPQSLLGNFTADAIQELAAERWGKVDCAVMNVGGMRSTLNAGTITTGNLYEIYSFDNRLVLLELPGKAVKEFFNFIAQRGGQGLSHSVEVVVKDKAVVSLKINGEPLDENATYRVGTIDYLAEGNDGMVAFKQATKYLDSNETLRDVMIGYVKSLTVKNQKADAKMDNRITVLQ